MNDQPNPQPNPANGEFHSPQPLPRAGAESTRILGVFSIRDILLGLSLVSLVIAMIGATFLVGQVLWGDKSEDAINIMDRIHIIMPLLMLTYALGCGLAIVGVRRLNSLTLPWILDVITWLIILGIVVFYMYVLTRLWMETYQESTLIKFAIVLVGGFVVLVGIQFGTRRRSLVGFSIPLLFMNMTHLFALVFRYVLLFDRINPALFKFDIGFFIGMVLISLFMVRGKTFGRIQNMLDRLFEEDLNKNQKQKQEKEKEPS